MKTTDIYFASALSALGANLVNVDKTDPRHMEFEFTPRNASTGALATIELPTMNLDVLERAWANKTLDVNAVEYADAIKRLKSVVHSKL